MHSTCFVVNPYAGSGRAERVWARLCERTPGLGAAPTIRAADPEVAAASLRALMARVALRRVVAVGGDGTLHQVINAVMAADAPPEVGVLPIGSGADLARGLGLPRSSAVALRHALDGPARAMDLLRLRVDGETRHVANIASLGISGEVAAAVNRQRTRSPLAYLSGVVRALRHYAPPPVRILLDDAPWYEGPLLILALANGSTFGRGMRIAPQADPHDGRAEVVLAEPVPFWRLLPRLPSLYLGAHLGLDFVRHAPARRVRVESLAGPLGFEMDGESRTGSVLELEVVPAAVRMVV